VTTAGGSGGTGNRGVVWQLQGFQEEQGTQISLATGASSGGAGNRGVV
jgi:hypothetical protein